MTLIGKPKRRYTIEPLENPVTASRPAAPASSPAQPPSKPLVSETVGTSAR
jgi:hypothetical protein